MSAIAYDQIEEKGSDETLTYMAGFLGGLKDGDLLTGTPTATEQGTSDLTITSVAKLASSVTRHGVAHAANQGVTLKIAGGTAGVTYKVKVTCATVNGNTLVYIMTINVVP